MGIRFELNCEVGKDIELAQLLADYDAVFVGAGTYRSMKADLPNEEAPGVYEALPFLIANTKQVMGLEALADEPYIDTAGLNVVVLGGRRYGDGLRAYRAAPRRATGHLRLSSG